LQGMGRFGLGFALLTSPHGAPLCRGALGSAAAGGCAG
jgi:hypothetical protein